MDTEADVSPEPLRRLPGSQPVVEVLPSESQGSPLSELGV